MFFKKRLLLALSIIINFSFLFWYFTDFKITQWGNIDLTTSNFIESYYWTKKNIFWSELLNRINKIKDSDLKIFFIQKYTEIIPVNQWWSPIRTQKNQALDMAQNIYTKNQEWGKLEKISKEYININPSQTLGWFKLGLAQEKQGKENEAIESYYQVLSQEADNIETIIQLGNLLIQKGDFYSVKNIIQPYLKRIIEVEPFCFYWGTDFFTSEQQSCKDKTDKNQYLIPIKNSKTANMIRLDPPQGMLILTSINFVNSQEKRGQAENEKIYDFSKWTTSKDMVAEKENIFHSIGPDPYLYIKLSTPLDLTKYHYVLIEAKHDSPKIDPQIELLLLSLQEKIDFEL